MEVRTFLKKVATGLDFATVVKALDGGMSNVASETQGELDAFLEKHGLSNVPRVLMATHSIGGRRWKFAEGREPAFFRENVDGGWYALTNEDADYLYYSSAASGSNLTAEKEGETWKVTLEVPVDNGEPYQGSYWTAFHAAIA